MAQRRVRRPERRPEPGRRPLPEETYRHITSRVFEASPELLELLLRQRAWSYDLWPEGAEAAEEEGAALEEPQEEPDDPDYDGRLADEDEDFSEISVEEEGAGAGEREGGLALLEALEALPPEQGLQRQKAVADIHFELLPQEEAKKRIVFWSPLGARWMQMEAKDSISSRYKEAVRERIWALSVLAELLIEENGDYLQGTATEPKPLHRTTAIQRLRERLGLQWDTAKGRVSRLVRSSRIRLPDGTIRPLEELFERPKELQTAIKLFYALAAYYDEEREKPLSDRALSEKLPNDSGTGRSNIQRIRKEWLPNSRERARRYQEGKELAGLLREKVGDDPEKLQKLLEILEKAREWAKGFNEARAWLAQERLTEWSEALEEGKQRPGVLQQKDYGGKGKGKRAAGKLRRRG